jgi:hypothetical protein
LRIEYKGLMTQHRKLLLILYTGVKQANTQWLHFALNNDCRP